MRDGATRRLPGELDDLIHRVVLPGFLGTTAPHWLLRRLERGLGGVVLFARNTESGDQVAELTAQLRAVRPEVLVAVDEEGGDVTRLEAATGSTFLGAAALGVADDLAATRSVAAGIGALLAGCGIDWTFAPDADVNSRYDNPVIGVRSYGPEPDLVAAHVAAAVHGFQDDAGILSCAKHFPGHGDTAVDSHLALPVVDLAADRVRDTLLPPFRAAIAAGVVAVMTAHLRVTSLDPDLPATLSRTIVDDVLRGELGFEGVVVSDALEMAGVSAFCGIGEGAVRAVCAGVDALCLGGELAGEDVVDTVVGALTEAVSTGRLSDTRLADAARRVDRLVARRATAATNPALIDSGREMSKSVAARSLQIHGDPRLDPRRAVAVLTAEPAAMVAVGRIPWGVSGLVTAARTDVVALRCDEACRIDDVLPRLADRQLVLVLRDAGRHAWQRALATSVVAARPDTIVVEMGLPGTSPVHGRGRIDTYGASLPSAAAAADALMAGA